MNDTILNDILNRAVSSHSENGAALAVTKDGRSVCALSAGLADVENRIPFSGNTICRAFSCTKVVTGTAAKLFQIAGPVLAMCSDSFSYMTGSYILADGGQSIPAE